MRYVPFPSPKISKLFWILFLLIFHKATEITGHTYPKKIGFIFFSRRLSTVFQYQPLLTQAIIAYINRCEKMRILKR